MKKLFCLAAAATMILTGCSNDSSSTADTSTTDGSDGVFTVGMECAYAPFNWQTTEETETSVSLGGAGYCDGYDVVIAQAIADEIGETVEVKKIAWDGLQPALESGEIDAIIAGMTANEEREQGVDFTTPYYESQMVLIVPKDSEQAALTDIQDFKDYKVIGQKNTNYDTIIDQIEGIGKNHVTPLATYPELVVALQNGTADAITAELPVAEGIVSTNPDLTYIVFEEGKGFDVDTTVSIGLKDGTRNTEYFKKIQAALDKISQDQRDAWMIEAVQNQPSSEE